MDISTDQLCMMYEDLLMIFLVLRSLPFLSGLVALTGDLSSLTLPPAPKMKKHANQRPHKATRWLPNILGHIRQMLY